MTMTPELQALLKVAQNLTSDELPRLLGDLETVRAIAWSRLTLPKPVNREARGELLDVDEAAARLGMSASYLYRNHKRFSFSRRVGRALRFSSEGIDSYIQESGVLTPRRRNTMLAPVIQQEDKRK
jgi:predicted DNA-binding transcriptional regulator AlpA